MPAFTPAPVAPSQNDEAARLSDLQRRLSSLEQQLVPSPSASAPTAEAPPEAAPTTTDDQLDARAFQQAQLQAFESEAPDRSWAPQAQNSLARGLGALSERARFSVVNVECKTSQCRAEVRWNSYSEAISNWTAVLHETLEPNCIQRMSLPTPADADAPYTASAFFDCTEVRAGG